nr:MAG TPA: hypothetical protein [Caudoviricetes sp.]
MTKTRICLARVEIELNTLFACFRAKTFELALS